MKSEDEKITQTKNGTTMIIHIDIRNNISPTIALECVKQVIRAGKVSANGKSYCYATTFDTIQGEVWVAVRPYRKSDCFLVYKNNR